MFAVELVIWKSFNFTEEKLSNDEWALSAQKTAFICKLSKFDILHLGYVI